MTVREPEIAPSGTWAPAPAGAQVVFIRLSVARGALGARVVRAGALDGSAPAASGLRGVRGEAEAE
jgi:hypothetical protein